MTPADLLLLLAAIKAATICDLDERYPQITTTEMQLLVELRGLDEHPH